MTTSQARMRNLREIAERLGGNGMFMFTTFDQVTPETILTVPIWSVAGHAEPKPLVW